MRIKMKEEERLRCWHKWLQLADFVIIGIIDRKSVSSTFSNIWLMDLWNTELLE